MPTNRLPNLPHVTLENPWIIRSWCIVDRLATTEYKIRPADYRWHIAARHDLVHEFAPHTKNPKILQQANEWKNPEDLRQAVDEAAEAGVDVVLLFTDGWKPNRHAAIKPVDQPTSHPLTLDDHGQAILELHLPAYKVECYEITWF